MGRNIVICCDGTNNHIAGDQTNVLRLYRMLVRDESQITYYDAGVGTHADPTAQWPIRRMIHKKVDMAIGMSIRENVLDAYLFLIDSFSPGDQIYLFGFSRGAYTVRALAAMLKRCGLLRPHARNVAAYAWSVLTDEDRTGDREQIFGGTARIKKVFSDEVPVHCVGVWDTVSAFGWIWDMMSIPNTASNDIVRYIRHAVAIDERRSSFAVNLFYPPGGQDCQQVWFAGVHSDVGGGYPAEDGGLSRISLEWMLGEVVPMGLKIDFDEAGHLIGRIGRKGEDPALATMHDEAKRKAWRFQGWLPMRRWCPVKKRPRWGWPNWARRRRIPQGSMIHESVVKRMNNAGLRYKPVLPDDRRQITTRPFVPKQ